jgi:hypothetical protein
MEKNIKAMKEELRLEQSAHGARKQQPLRTDFQVCWLHETQVDTVRIAL